MRFKIKPEVYFGSGAINHLKNLNLSRVMIISDPFLLENGMIGKLTNLLDSMGVKYSIFSDIVPDTPFSKIISGLKLMETFQPKEIITIGGGSAIDTSKAIRFFYSKIKINEPPVRLFTIPTTSGTGSEATKYAVILDDKTNLKHTLVDEAIIPDYAILDIDFVKSVPDSVAIASGLDVLAHGLESYVAKDSNNLTELFSLEAIKRVLIYLPKAIQDKDIGARGKMHVASFIAGAAFENTGLGINHSLAHVLGGEYDLPHGWINALILPYVIRFNGDNMEYNKYLKLADELNINGFSSQIKFENLIKKIENFTGLFNIPKSLSQLKEPKITYDDYIAKLDTMAKVAYNDGLTLTNPVMPSLEDMASLLEKIYKG